MSLTGIGQGLAQNYLMYQIFAFLNALGNAGMYPLIFVIGKNEVFNKPNKLLLFP